HALRAAEDDGAAPRREAARRGAPRSHDAGAIPALTPLADQVERAARAGVRRVHCAGRQHEPIPGAETVVRAGGAEGDLAFDDPETLVVVVAVRRVVRVRGIAPRERLEAVRVEAGTQCVLGRRRAFAPGNALEPH